jgi:hypothetical protein
MSRYRDITSWWIIVDTTTGAMDGYYRYPEDARGAFDRAVSQGANSLVLCEVKDSTTEARIGDATFWTRHPSGYAGTE